MIVALLTILGGFAAIGVGFVLAGDEEKPAFGLAGTLIICGIISICIGAYYSAGAA